MQVGIPGQNNNSEPEPKVEPKVEPEVQKNVGPG